MTGGLKENHWTPAVLGAALQDGREFDEAGGGKILCNDSSRPAFESTKQKWLWWLRHYAAVIQATRSRNLFVFLQQNLQTNETLSLENKQTLVSFFLSLWWLCDVVSHTHTHTFTQTDSLPSYVSWSLDSGQPFSYLWSYGADHQVDLGTPPPTTPTPTHTHRPSFPTPPLGLTKQQPKWDSRINCGPIILRWSDGIPTITTSRDSQLWN